MKKTSKKFRQTKKFISVVLALIILLSALPVCISAGAATIITYKIDVTSESKASGWNSARLELHYKDRSGNKSSDSWDIKNDISNGNTVTKIVTRYDTDKVPYMIRLYLDFGGGFTIRSHSGRVKLYVEGQEIMNEAYSARSYPFSSSNETMDFAIYGLVPAEVIAADGSSKSYATVKQAWSEAKNMEGSTVKLSNNASITGTLEVTNNMTIDLNGCLIANTEVSPLFSVKSGGKLNIIDSDSKRDTGEDYIVTTGLNSEDDLDDRTYHLTGGGIFHGGSESSGGAVTVDKGGTLSVKGCTFTDIHSAENGGAIYCEGKLSLSGTKFIFCTALEGKGGAIALNGEPNVSLENLTFDRCSSKSGGAVSTTNGEENAVISKFDNCTFNNCQAEEYGGGIYFASGMGVAANKLTFNKCAAEYGGGVYNTSSTPVTLIDSKFDGCFADYGGGLSYNEGGDMKLDRVEVNQCSANKHGGGLCIISVYDVYSAAADFSSAVSIDNSDIHNCTAKDKGGGVYVYNDSKTFSETVKTKLYKTSVYDNTAKTGGGVYVESDYVYLIGSSIRKNQAESKNGGGVYVDSMYDIELAEDVVIRDNLAKGDINNLCLQNGIASTAYAYCGGLYDGAYIGISSTGSSDVTAVKNISQFQAGKFIHSDDYRRSLSMTNTREVETPLFASMISDNISLILIIGGVVVIAGIILILYFRKRRKEGKKDEAKAEQIESDNDEENE